MKTLLGSILLLLAAGCSQPTQHADLYGPQTIHSATVASWSFDGKPARIIKTDHYLIHTTIQDDDFLDSLTQVMEGSLEQYQRLAPGVQLSDRPMDCYVFSRRPEWARFTQQHTGSDADVYLQINRGGYTVRDWFVAYFIGDVGTYAVASHEGWHQFVARNFHSRLPPFLEEGIATMFENITWYQRLPRWNLDLNPGRAEKLRAAIEDHRLWPLQQLCTMHAGDVVGMSGERIETFYAQDWAFAQFLINGDGGKYRPALTKMMNDLASGESDQYTGHHHSIVGTWDPQSVQPLLEHYLSMNMNDIDEAYQSYIRQIAFNFRDNHQT